MKKKKTLYNVKFDELFDNKREAVVCFLSLERRYVALVKQFDKEKLAAARKGKDWGWP